MSRNDIMVDLETLGVSDGATIFQLAAASFDIQTGEVHSEIDLKLDVSKAENLKVDGGTLRWWLKTNSDLLANLISEGNLTEVEMFTQFAEWVEETKKANGTPYLWGNGIAFDNVKIEQKMTSLGLKYPINFRKERDVRTILDLASMISGESEREIFEDIYDGSEVAHNALDDVKRQIRLVHYCYNILNEK